MSYACKYCGIPARSPSELTGHNCQKRNVFRFLTMNLMQFVNIVVGLQIVLHSYVT